MRYTHAACGDFCVLLAILAWEGFPGNACPPPYRPNPQCHDMKPGGQRSKRDMNVVPWHPALGVFGSRKKTGLEINKARTSSVEGCSKSHRSYLKEIFEIFQF